MSDDTITYRRDDQDHISRELYSLKLGESFCVGAHCFYRVPGGWVMLPQYNTNGVFIPFDNEFMPGGNIKKDMPNPPPTIKKR